MKGALDSVWKVHLDAVLIAAFVLYTGMIIWKLLKKKTEPGKNRIVFVKWAVTGGVLCLLLLTPATKEVIARCKIPVVTLAFIILVSALIQYITTTKLGQDFRSVGSDIHIAEAAGINVNRVRILAMIFSTVIASWGQFAFLQNMGTFSTYTAQQNVGTFSIAALLVGGATIDKANVKQAFIGVFLFQLLFLLAPAAGTKIFNDSQVGEYFRTVISNGVIAVALVLHAMNKFRMAAAAEAEEV